MHILSRLDSRLMVANKRGRGNAPFLFRSQAPYAVSFELVRVRRFRFWQTILDHIPRRFSYLEKTQNALLRVVCQAFFACIRKTIFLKTVI